MNENKDDNEKDGGRHNRGDRDDDKGSRRRNFSQDRGVQAPNNYKKN